MHGWGKSTLGVFSFSHCPTGMSDDEAFLSPMKEHPYLEKREKAISLTMISKQKTREALYMAFLNCHCTSGGPAIRLKASFTRLLDSNQDDCTLPDKEEQEQQDAQKYGKHNRLLSDQKEKVEHISPLVTV